MTKFMTIILAFLFVTSNMGYAQRRDWAQERRQDHRREHRREHRQEIRRDHRSPRRVHVPRRRTVRGVVVVRPYGHVYHGFGHLHHDHDAWKWLAFTAMSLKILDLINEEAQRQHEQAIIEASQAPVGKKITWEEGDAQGYAVATKQGRDENGLTCREFQQEINIGGKTEKGYGTACLQADGSWKIVQ